MVAAAKILNAHEFLMNLPDGYDTRSGSRGVKLSGGRNSAWPLRARCSGCTILILDEATSSVDTHRTAHPAGIGTPDGGAQHHHRAPVVYTSAARI